MTGPHRWRTGRDTYQARTTVNSRGGLLLSPDDPDEDTYILVYEKSPSGPHKEVGWKHGKAAREQGYSVRDYGPPWDEDLTRGERPSGETAIPARPLRDSIAIQLDAFGTTEEPEFTLLRSELGGLKDLWQANARSEAPGADGEQGSATETAYRQFSQERLKRITAVFGNGPSEWMWAVVEVPEITPVRYELQELVKVWEKRALEIEFDLNFMGGTFGMGLARRLVFSSRRIKRLRQILGDGVVQRAMDTATQEFGSGVYDPRHWEIFRYGDEAQWRAVADETHRRIEMKERQENSRPDSPGGKESQAVPPPGEEV